jgi:2-amino-4-hydroxy-6-hydroxymethyldihydropteridine diphosphokinase
MAQVFIGLGSNLKDRAANIKKAIRLLKKEGIRIEKISKVIETKPVGGPAQANFLNAAIKIKTDLSPRKLLRTIKGIEHDMDRRPGVRFGPRLIDLDILLYDKLVLKSKTLTIPHPRMWGRSFVLEPLSSLISRKALVDFKRLSKV